MNRVRFNLNIKRDNSANTPNGDNREFLIIMIFRHAKGTLKYSTGEKVRIKDWNPVNMRVRGNSTIPRGRLINTNLNRLERILNDLMARYSASGEFPTNEMLKTELDIIYRGKDGHPGKINNVNQYIDLFIHESAERVASNTMKVYRTTQKAFKEWLNGDAITFPELKPSVFKDFVTFLRKENNQESTVSKYSKTLRTFINAAVLDDRTTASINAPSNKTIGIKKYESDNVFLTEDEISKLLNLNLEDHLEKVRDAFVISCYTGLRISDLRQLDSTKILRLKGIGEIISIVPVKTDSRVEIPLKPIVKKLLQKHSFQILDKSEQRMNDQLKVIAKMAGLNAPFVKRIYRNGKRIEREYAKHELISMHTGRRSFVTNLLLSRISPYEIMKMTGHKSLKSFESYIRFTERDNAIRLISADYFK